MSPILNAVQVAELLGCTPQTVADHARAGRLPGYKFGDGWVFSTDLIIDAVKKLSLVNAEQRSKPAKPTGELLPKPKRKQIPGFDLLPPELKDQLRR